MFVYEFECPKGHLIEDRVPMGTKQWPCTVCMAEIMAQDYSWPPPNIPMATRVLSPTRTTFVFADTHRR